jgi:predicted dehydrogenase
MRGRLGARQAARGNEMDTTTPLEVAIVGGGRRGKTLCRALAGLRQVHKIHLVSRRNARGMQDWIMEQQLAGRLALHGKLDPVLWNTAIRAVIVANLPGEHFATARWLLENGKHVLVEKPFVPTRAEARGLVLAAGLQFFLATYLHYFRSVVHNQGHPHPVELTEITWHDALAEERCSLARRPDVTAPVIAELLPHVLTVLTVLFGRHAARTTAVVPHKGNFSARLELAYGPHPVRVSLSRVAAEPRRSVEVVTREGRRFMLDFTREPGTVLQDGRALPDDLLWDALPRPLPAELAYFLDEVRQRQGTLPLLAKETMHIVEGTEQAVAGVLEEQLRRLQPAEREYLPPRPAVMPAMSERR